MRAGRAGGAGVGVLVGFALLLGAWVGANPPGAAPDERAHYVKALGAVTGQPIGTAAPLRAGESLQARFRTEFDRFFLVPAGLAPPPDWGCTAFHRGPASCLTRPDSGPARQVQTSAVGVYLPALYVPLGLAGLAAGHPTAALFAQRAVSAATCLLLLAGTLALVGRGWRLVGMLASLTPMTVFLASAVSTNGIEVFAGLMQAAALVRLADEDPPAYSWVLGGVSGVLLALARPLGPAWIALALVLLLVLLGWRGLRARVARRPRLAAVTGAAVLVAAGSGAAWDLLVVPRIPVPLTTVLAGVLPTLRQLPWVLTQTVGAFGWLDTTLPRPLVAAVAVAIGLLLVTALRRGATRPRWALLVLLSGWLGLAVALSAVQELPFGFQVQGRYLLPLAVFAGILAGRALEGRRLPRALLPAVLAGTAAVQLLSWVVNARRYAVGARGTWWFWQHPGWQPAGGWLPWSVLAVAGAAVLLVTGVATAPRVRRVRLGRPRPARP